MTGPAAKPVGDLAIVLHSHMPYVEGFGTYPFGEEWLFEAVARSHIPVLEAARSLTMTVTPVLADQLEADGVAERMLGFLREYRLAAAERDVEQGPGELRRPALFEAERYRIAIERLEALDGRPLAAFAAAQERGVELMASAATHPVLPLLATMPGRRLQIDAGLRSHRRRFGSSAGFWLPECAFRPGLEAELAERGVRYFCVDQSRHEDPAESLAPARAANGLAAFPLHWPTIELVWGREGYPSDPAYQEYHRQSLEGMRLWAIGGGPYDPQAAAEHAREHAHEFLKAASATLAAFADSRARPGLLVFAIDTELLGAWWSEGPVWLEAVLAAAADHEIRLVTLSQALAEHEPVERPLHESSWGEGKDLRTWDSPPVADLVWSARRLELRLLRALDAGELDADAARRAARELLAAQSSDWAFLDSRGEAGEYAFQRAVAHSRAMLEALDSARPSDPRMRNLAPDMSLAPLLEP